MMSNESVSAAGRNAFAKIPVVGLTGALRTNDPRAVTWTFGFVKCLTYGIL
jgi:hypothetical protein